MAQFYTLDEAAERLGLGVDEFKRRLKTEWTAIRPFRDGPTLRFRTADIDELARSLGQASDPGLTLGPPGSALGDSSEEMAIPDSGHDLAADDIFTVRGGEQKSKAPADSDVRLDIPSGKPPAAGGMQTDELSIDLGAPSSGKLSAPKSGARLTGQGKIPGPESAPVSSADSSSEFELSLDADSDSFDLQLSTDSGNEVDLGAVLDAPGGASGINLAKPSDSGVSLEKKGSKLPPSSADSDVDFELSLDAGAPRSGGVRKPGPPAMGDDSSSEFELTLDDNSGVAENLAQSLQAQADAAQGDIFETDFELPAVGDDSGSEVVAVDDTDLEGAGYEVDVAAEDESGSQVMLVDSDEAAAVLDEAEAEEEAGAALAGVSRLADDDDRVVAVAAPPAPWPGWVVAPLALTLLFAFLGGLMSFESIRGMWGYHQPGKPANALVRGMADTLGMKVSD